MWEHSGSRHSPLLTPSGVYTDYYIDAMGSDRIIHAYPSAADVYVMSGFVGEGFCDFTASGKVKITDADHRSKTIVTVYEAPSSLYVGAFDSELTPPYRSPMSNNIVLDYDENAVTVGPNEFVTSELLNTKIGYLQHDLEQVMRSAKVFANSPFVYIGYLGRGFLRGGTLGVYDMWVDMEGDGEHSITNATSAIMDNPTSGAASVCIDAGRGLAYFADFMAGDRYVVGTVGTTPVLASGNYSDVYSEEGYVNPRITSVKVDADGRCYFAVPDMNRVVCYSAYDEDGNGTVRFLYDWGGFGGPDAKLKFNNPVCISIDEGTSEMGQSIYVLDKGNSCVKKYNLSGVWRGTVKYVLGKGEAAVWMDVDVNGRIHVLTSLRDLILERNGVVVAEYRLPSVTPVCVFRNRNHDFVYIMTDTDILKITGDGDFICRFSDGEQWKDVRSAFGVPAFAGSPRSGYADEYDQIWVLFDGLVVAYSDVVRQVRLYAPEVEDLMWKDDDLRFAKDEYLSDFIVNTVFQRMYDNVNLVRRSMHSKIDYREKNGKTYTSIVGLSPVEYRKLNIPEKDDLTIPLNAPMTSESFNYGLRMIYSAIETLLSFVQDETVV